MQDSQKVLNRERRRDCTGQRNNYFNVCELAETDMIGPLNEVERSRNFHKSVESEKCKFCIGTETMKVLSHFRLVCCSFSFVNVSEFQLCV